MKVDAVVLAGAPNNGQLKEVSGEKWEATIPIHGKPMVNYVIETLQNSKSVENLLVVGPLEIKDALPPHVTLVESGDTLTDNIFIGLNALEKKNMVLYVTADIPFVHPECIDDFVDRCAELDAEIYYPLISKEANLQVYPETVRTYFKLKEGTFTGGNIIMASPEAIADSRWIMDEVIFNRKQPWKIFRLLGFRFILKFLTKRLTLQEIEKQASGILGHNGILIISPYPELGTDVDKPSDLALATRLIGSVQGKEA